MAALIAQAIMGAAPLVSGQTLYTHAPDQFLVAPNTDAILPIRADGFSGSLNYSILNYQGATLYNGTATASGNALNLGINLNPGYYEVAFSGQSKRFGVVSLPPPNGPRDGFFGMDAALSWLVSPGTTRNAMVSMMARSGFGMVRERLTWSSINPANDQLRWNTSRQYESLRKTYESAGLPILEMFHDAPSWMGRTGPYPVNLISAANSWRSISQRWESSWGGVEVWNEPDISFGGFLPANQYMPLVNAVRYATQQENVGVPVGGGAFAYGGKGYVGNAIDNGLLDRVDYVSFHSYGQAMSLENTVRRYREQLAAAGQASIPLWLTESGRPWSGGGDRAPLAQDAASALDITMKAVEARATGVERYFAFVLPEYGEGNQSFGLTGTERTPMRSYAAYATAASKLAGMEYLGDLNISNGLLQRARVFGNGNHCVVVLYTGSVSANASVTLPGIHLTQIEGIDGRNLNINANGSIPIPDGLTYLWTTPQAISAYLNADTSAMQLYQLAQQAPPTPKAASPIILQHVTSNDVLTTSDFYQVTMDELGQYQVQVRVSNLDLGSAKTVVLTPGGAGLSGQLTPQQITLAPQSTGTVSWTLDMQNNFQHDDRVSLRINAVALNDAASVSPMVIPIRAELPIANYLAMSSDHMALPIDTLGRWRNVSASGSTVQMTSDGPGHWKLDVAFTGSRWSYPELQLPNGIDLTSYSGILLELRCENPADVRVLVFESGSVNYFTPVTIALSDGQWHTAFIRFDELLPNLANAVDPNGILDLDLVSRIAIGFNSRVNVNSLEVRAAYLIHVPEPASAAALLIGLALFTNRRWCRSNHP